jgi:hypothetical protein
LIVRPDAASFGAGTSLVLIALLFATIRDLTTRGLASDIPSIFAAAASSAERPSMTPGAGHRNAPGSG